ncbi:hypothetical protein G9A89_006800 [Geosiphon pyriformis]|nr:hypothetical protein G9A89_006800 [Geosiphon pyriformis]
MEIATLLAKEKGIDINSNLKRQEMRSDRAVVIKEISMDAPKDIIITAFAELDQTDLLASKWLFLIGKDSVHIAKTVGDSHDLRTLLNRAVGFESDNDLESAFCIKPILGGIKLSWTKMDLVRCEKCEKFGHSALKYDAPVAFPSEPSKIFKRVASDGCHLQLAKLYKKKNVLISQLAAFGGKSWAQVVSLAGPSGGSHFSNGSSSSPPLFGALNSINDFSLISANNSSLNDHLNTLECFLELLTNQAFSILKKLSGIELVPTVISSSVFLPATPAFLIPRLDVDMALDDMTLASTSTPLFSAVNDIVHDSSSSFSKVLIFKVGGLELKVVAFEISISSIATCNIRRINNSAKQNNIICWHKDMNNLISIFTKTNSGVAIVMDNFQARHVCKISEVSEQLFFIRLLFNNKLSVTILGLYASASSDVQFFQADNINLLIAKAVNEFFFVVLGGDFNKNGLRKSTSFKKCSNFGLVNSLGRNLFAKMLMWANFQGVSKTIDYIFISHNLISAVVDCGIANIGDYFDSDHRAVSYKFKMSMAANAAMFSKEFAFFVVSSNLDSIDGFSTNNSFKKKWFKGFDSIFIKGSFRFYRLEILVSKIVKASYGQDSVRFIFLMSHWASLDSDKVLAVQVFLNSGVDFDCVRTALFGVWKSYCASKLAESLKARESSIRSSVLKCPFCKVELDHLVVGDELILEPELVKTKSLKYVFDGAFSDVMQLVVFNELFGLIFDLPDGKAAGLSSISNKFWKYCDKSVIDMLLELLNTCLIIESVPSFWKKAWVSMIPKSYEWEGVFTNIHSIALIETAHKILSKILSDRISLTCNRFNVLCGDNFSVLKSTSIQSPIFTVGSVIEDALKKNFMTDFSLTDKYHVHNGLDQRKIFLPLLWCIFYNSLFYKVKRQKSVCEYRLNSHFISKNGHSEFIVGLSFFFAAGAFVDDTIWVGSSQSTTQHILNIASKFFQVNDISINTDKTVVIPINCKVGSSSLVISGSPIAIVKRGKFHQYLGIYLSTKSLSKSNLAKTQLDIWFFSNLVLRKAISDKQFLYLVSAVIYPIDTLVWKDLKLKSNLPFDFSNNLIHHSSLYGLKSFEQMQFEGKIVLLVSFTNSGRTLGHMFFYRSYDLQVLLHVRISLLNNFLAGVIHILAKNNLSLSGSLDDPFHCQSGVPMLMVLEEAKSCACLFSLYQYDLGTVWRKTGTTVFFDNIGLGLGIKVTGLLSSTLAELQAIALALKCVPPLSSVCLHSDSQTALDACKSELHFICPDFCI